MLRLSENGPFMLAWRGQMVEKIRAQQ